MSQAEFGSNQSICLL